MAKNTQIRVNKLRWRTCHVNWEHFSTHI